MKKQYNKPVTKEIELTYNHHLLEGSMTVKGSNYASDIGFGGEASDFETEPE